MCDLKIIRNILLGFNTLNAPSLYDAKPFYMMISPFFSTNKPSDVYIQEKVKMCMNFHVQDYLFQPQPLLSESLMSIGAAS